MQFVDILGYLAGFITTLTFLPQVIKTWKEKSATNVSLMMFIIAIVNEIMWIGYGVLREDMVIILTNAIMLSMASVMVFLKFKYK